MTDSSEPQTESESAPTNPSSERANAPIAASTRPRAERAKRQTASFLSDRLTAAGLRPVSRYGQNFLIDLNLVELIARSADLSRDDVVLEVGTGVGSLTSIMAEEAGAILTVEVDENLHRLASEELAGQAHVKLLQADALKNKNTLNPQIMPLVSNAMTRLGENARLKLVANLPYNIATPLISNLLHQTPTPTTMVVTIQKELGERIIATPGSKDYGALSVWIGSFCKASIVRILPPTVFWPRPKVESAIVRIDVDVEARNRIPNLKYYHDTVRALFFHRRKFLRSVVCSAMKGRLEKPEVDAVLQRLGHDETRRAEQLDVTQIATLAEALRTAERNKSITPPGSDLAGS